MLCRRAEADPNICGRKLKRKGICAHEFCVFFANELFQKCIEDSGFMGFIPEDIRCTIEWAEEKVRTRQEQGDLSQERLAGA
ncbi:phd finger protein hypothetical protein [Limosa lapponica baueri]|uniref:Uncharacterized protein n=1 Tax=Limosa lapponica baueri TaxID=1758121 RepID=A0A2I0TC72_LIMLA|nr:phd finger protein hypothetical protein [Limosa lapponica baueri]